MDAWVLARYLIDAKKCVDSIIYISDNAEKLQYINLRDRINQARDKFYINCAIVLDDYISSKHIAKRTLCDEDNIVNTVYYERDKNVAHKDGNYEAVEFNSLSEMIDLMKQQISHIKAVCKDILPEVLSLDFVSHDRELFRLIHHLTKDEEDEIYKRKYPLRGTIENTNHDQVIIKEILNDIEDLKKIPQDKIKDYAVVMEDGVCFEEGIQTRQDACIRINTLFGLNMWCSVNAHEFVELKELQALGCFDEYGIIQAPPDDPEKLKAILEYMKKNDQSN